ncbi:MAG: hypothetical protein GY711_07085 [bacterium]|nr:hypothetical protein [bacterium]
MSRAVLSFVASCTLASVSLAQDEPQAPDETIEYTSFKGQDRQLYPWTGEHIVFLTQANDLDPGAMAGLIEVFDGIWSFYAEATGRRPRKFKEHEGKAIIAVEPDTCGAGCGYLGYTGIELMPDYFTHLYETFRDSGEIDQVLPYEFGRNFWFYGEQLEYHGKQNTGTITTGYAVLMRFWALEAVERSVGPFQGAPGVVFTETIHGLVDEYESSKKASWKNTLLKGRGVANRLNLGATDLFASLLMRARSVSAREDFVTRVWRFAGEQPPAEDTKEAAGNLVVAASLAAETDLTELFKSWGFPVSRAVRKRIKEGLADGALLSAVGSETAPEAGVGSYVFEATTATSEKPLRVWYYVPDRTVKRTKVLFVLHDRDRGGERLRNRWLEIAKNKRVVLLVPEFSELHYPDSRSYELGNRFDADGGGLPEEQWTFNAIDPVFDHASQALGLHAESYSMYGYGAGAQFIQRFVFWRPERVDVAVAANAGSYTPPVSAEAWPHGLADESLSPAQLARAFEAQLIVAVGKKAIEPSGDTAEIRAQGLNLVERGESFFQAARKRAKSERTRLRWKLELVSGAGDSSYYMRSPASRLLGL